MLELYRQPYIKGFTTNPTLMRKADVTDYERFALEILQLIPDRPISFEVFADDEIEMERQARKIARSRYTLELTPEERLMCGALSGGDH
jgi:transaldolase